MAIKVLFAASNDRWINYHQVLPSAFAAAGLDVNLARNHPPDCVDYIVLAPDGTVTDFSPFVRCKAVLSLWAGVEAIIDNHTLTQPLVRMVDTAGLTQGMVEWVTGHVLRHHLGIDAQITGQDGRWRRLVPPLSADRPVTILGFGALGSACANALANLGFSVTGWSRRPKPAQAKVKAVYGDAGLANALRNAQIVVLLLPLTSGTENILNAERLALMAPGGFVINPGRGGLVDDAALLAALDCGHIAHATLDVFRVEPLPTDHPYWRHPRVTVTPHIASETRPKSAAGVIAESIRRAEAGDPIRHLVDRERGY